MSDNEALFESEEDNDTKGEEKEGIIIANSHFNPLTNTIESVKQETTSSSNLNHNNDNTTLKTTLKGSKFKVNLLKKVVLSDDDKRVEDEDDTQNDDTNFIQSSKQSTNFKKRYQYKEQVHTASGPFAMGPSSQIQSNIAVKAIKSEKMGFEKVGTKSGNNSGVLKEESQIDWTTFGKAGDKVVKKTKEAEIDADEDRDEIDEKEYLKFTINDPFLPVQVDLLNGKQANLNLDKMADHESMIPEANVSSLFLFQFPKNEVFTGPLIEPGKIGKFYKLKDGSRLLKLGRIVYRLSEGLMGEYVQDVVCLNADSKSMFELGKLDGKFVAVPDLESM